AGHRRHGIHALGRSQPLRRPAADRSTSAPGDRHMVNRDTMLREMVRRQEAAVKAAYIYPPQAEDLDHLPTWSTMMEDATVSGCVESIRTAVLHRPWYIEPADESDRAAVAVAADLWQDLLELDTESALDLALD